MSARQRAAHRRKYRAWCRMWFGVPYHPIPPKLQSPRAPQFGDGRTPKFTMSVGSVTVRPIGMDA